MPVGNSSLSLAIDGFADFLAGNVSEDVTITVDTPQKAQEQAKGSSTDILNVFVYRLAPSGFHADVTHQEPGFVRAHILLTPFTRAQNDEGATDLGLRVLGHALAVLHSNPVIPVVLPASPGSPEADAMGPETTFYQLQAVFQAPTMEEMNHIWTTQGGDLAYRLSIGFELALIPIEPLTRITPPEPVTAAILDVAPITPEGGTFSSSPMGFGDGGAWTPVIMFREGDALANTATVPPATATLTLAISGLPGANAEIEINWTRENGSEETSTETRAIAAVNLDSEEALITIPLANAANGDTARISARASADAPAGNVLMLTVGGG